MPKKTMPLLLNEKVWAPISIEDHRLPTLEYEYLSFLLFGEFDINLISTLWITHLIMRPLLGYGKRCPEFCRSYC